MDSIFQREVSTKIDTKSLLSLVVFISEFVIFLGVAIILIPLLNRVSEISRKLFMFMLVLDEKDMKSIISQTKNFIKIYIEKDIVEDDSFTKMSLNSSNYSIESSGKNDTVVGSK
jgi:hypothetical protein